MKIIRKKYTFYGSVQGVGFRCRAYYAARENNVTGWVKNNYDGSVEMEAEGEAENIENMLLAIEKGRFVRIENFVCQAVPVQNSRTFDIVG
ncbi:MAG: acylphosphatase [Ruminococcus sp.]|nr:acylphosphatase [Ruminococcus sp.]